MTKLVSVMSIVCLIIFSSCSGTSVGSMEVDPTQFLQADESNIIGIHIGDSFVDVEKLTTKKMVLAAESQEHNMKLYVLEGEYLCLELPCRIHIGFVDDKVNSISMIIDDRTEVKDRDNRFNDFEMIVNEMKEHYSEPIDELSNSSDTELGKFEVIGYRWVDDIEKQGLSLQVHYSVRDENSTNIAVTLGVTGE